MRGPNPAPRGQSSETRDLRTRGQLTPGGGSGLRAGPPLRAPLFHLLPDIREVARDPGQGRGGGGDTLLSGAHTPGQKRLPATSACWTGWAAWTRAPSFSCESSRHRWHGGRRDPWRGMGAPDALPSLEPGHL